VIHFNSRDRCEHYFIPFALELLLYPDNSDGPKHCTWISYIHDVILRELSTQHEKLAKLGRPDYAIQQDINEWVTLGILFQVEYVLHRRGEDIELG
jgi:hypothetical protein